MFSVQEDDGQMALIRNSKLGRNIYILISIIIAVMTHHDQKQLGEERVYLVCT